MIERPNIDNYKHHDLDAYYDALEEYCDHLTDKFIDIKSWCEAYPLKVFPEPDFEKAHKILTENGMTLDAISASNMRKVLNGIKDIIS